MRILIVLFSLAVGACGSSVTCEQACQPFLQKISDCCSYSIVADKNPVPTPSEWCNIAGPPKGRDSCLARADWSCRDLAEWSRSSGLACCQTATNCW